MWRSKNHVNVSLNDQIEELKRKIALLDGDRKAYYENSQWMMKNNKETIQKMRAKNKEIRLDLAKKKAGDEKVIDEAFQEKDPVRHCAMRGMSGKAAIAKLDQQVCETKKKLNAFMHQRKMREKRLQSLQTEYAQMVKDAEGIRSTDEGQSQDAQRLRMLENQLDKMNLKLNEANKIKSTYIQILEHQKEERRSWPKQLDTLEQAIRQQTNELKDLRAMQHDAQIARDNAKTELSKLEQSVYEAKRERETQLAEYKKQAEEKKEHAERVEKRLQRNSLQHEESGHEQKTQLSGEEQERRITTYEEAMAKIKDATGVSDMQEVVQRFLSQGDTQKHLERLKINNEKLIEDLKREKAQLQLEYENMKFSGDAKLSRGQNLIDEFENRLNVEKQRASELRQKQERTSRILVDVKGGIEHLADKLQHLKAPKSQVPTAKVSPDSEDYVLDLLGNCEQKLIKLMDDLAAKDIQDIVKEMEDAEFRGNLESKLPKNNTRIVLPSTNDQNNTYDDDDESGDDDDYLSRNAIKRYSQQIVDSRNKKIKPRPSKRKSKK